MLNKLAKQIVAWRIRKGFRTDWSNMPEKLILIVTEIAEAMEAYRGVDSNHLSSFYGRLHVNRKPKKHLGSYKKFENFKEELADAVIRILDITGTMGIDIEAEIKRKMKKNNMRPVRHGKQC